jgi:hypothetical protein
VNPAPQPDQVPGRAQGRRETSRRGAARMTQALKLDRDIGRLVRSILAEATGKGTKELRAWKQPQREISRLFQRDYARSLREMFGAADIRYLVGAACAIWPNFNRAPMGPPSMRLFAEVSAHLRLHFSSAPYRQRGGFAVRGFYLKTPAALGKPLIYVNSAHHLLAVGTAFCHEVGHHLSADMFSPANRDLKGARLYFGAEYSAHLDDPAELAADILVSLAGYPSPAARQIFSSGGAAGVAALPLGARGGKAFDAVREHLRSRYGFDFTAALPPTRKLHYLTGMIHYARLREALLAGYDL